MIVLAEQIINLPGTRVDTLWITVESGTDENRAEYKKQQRVAPRTFEEAVTDKNGTTLEDKLITIQEEIDNLIIGEFTGRIANNKELIFSGTTSDNDIQFVNKLDDAFLITTPNGIIITVAPDREYMTFFKNVVFENASSFNKGTFFGDNIEIAHEKELTFRNTKRDVSYRWKHASDDRFELLCDSEGVIRKGIVANRYGGISFPTGVSLLGIDITKSSKNNYIAVNNGINVGATFDTQLFGGGVVFLNSPDNGVVQKIVEYGPDGYLYFLYGDEIEGYTQSAHITSRGKWNFFQDISAPNLASTTELMALDREITEQDLSTIENQQAATEQDICNVEAQQLLTDMELMMIGGQVA